MKKPKKTTEMLAVFCLAAGAIFLRCGASPQPLATGGGSETRNGHLFEAQVVDSLGRGVPDIPVALVDAAYLPGSSLPQCADTSDIAGIVSITVKESGTFNLVATSERYRTDLFIPSIQIEKDTSLGAVPLVNPGILLIYVDTAAFQAGGALSVPGSMIAVPVLDTGVLKLPVPSALVNIRYIDNAGTVLPKGPHFDNVVVEKGAIVDSTGIPESLTVPAFIEGPRMGVVHQKVTFTTGGALSSKAVPVQYQFAWGDGDQWDTAWTNTGISSHAYDNPGTFLIAARSRSTLDPSVSSEWSKFDTIVIRALENVATPSMPIGIDTGSISHLYTFKTTRSLSSWGNPLIYQFSWGDSTVSAWQDDTAASHAWAFTGEHRVAVRCRSSSGATSAWSSSGAIVIVDKTPKQETPSGIPETPSVPMMVTGPSTGNTGISYVFGTSVSKTESGSPVEYQFSWGDSTFSTWFDETFAFKAWTGEGEKLIMARSRSVLDTMLISEWSPTHSITIIQESVPAPGEVSSNYSTVLRKYSQREGIHPTEYLLFSASSVVSSFGEPVEYRFFWGGADTSGWGKDSARAHSWATAGKYSVKVQARSRSDTTAVSPWSPGKNVTVVDSHVVSKPAKAVFVPGESRRYPYRYSFRTQGSVSSLLDAVEYRFSWGDGSFSDWIDIKDNYASHEWAGDVNNPDWYRITVQARSTRDTAVVSPVSDEFWFEAP